MRDMAAEWKSRLFSAEEVVQPTRRKEGCCGLMTIDVEANAGWQEVARGHCHSPASCCIAPGDKDLAINCRELSHTGVVCFGVGVLPDTPVVYTRTRYLPIAANVCTPVTDIEGVWRQRDVASTKDVSARTGRWRPRLTVTAPSVNIIFLCAAPPSVFSSAPSPWNAPGDGTGG